MGNLLRSLYFGIRDFLDAVLPIYRVQQLEDPLSAHQELGHLVFGSFSLDVELLLQMDDLGLGHLVDQL